MPGWWCIAHVQRLPYPWTTPQRPMCGIAGLLTLDGSARETAASVERMTDAQRHRGPDDAGCEIVSAAVGSCRAPTVVLGHRRLAIIDVSPAGHQPMHDAETGAWIVFNGEIYNFRELRRELEAAGHRFRSATDTEVILKAHAQWGSDCVERLRGIFAFALWAPREHSLLLARDQLGVKPLYYWSDRSTLGFASEVRAILASQRVARTLDPRALRSLLAYGSVQEPYTLVDGVRSVPPGHTLTWRDGECALRRYWRLPDPDEGGTIDGALSARLEATLAEATALQLVSDVPIGAFLSGGIDSTSVVALMQRASERPVRTFSIVFDDARYDERTFARAAARYIGTEHTELELTPDIARRELAAAIAAVDQPSVDGLNTYFVSKVTKEAGLTVALSGLGGDELFGGYEGYARARAAEQWARRFRTVPAGVRTTLAGAMHRFAGAERWRKAADLLETTRAPYFVTRQLFGSHQAEALLSPELLAAAEDWEPARTRELERETATLDSINRASALELQTYMVSTLLRDTDQMSMAHALEVRVPLLDHVLVENVFRLPGAMKVDAAQPKPLLTRTLAGLLPGDILRRPKRGFELPLARWLRDSLRSVMRERLLSGGALPLDRRAVADMVQRFETGRLGWARVWTLFILSDWLERHGVSA